VPAAQVSVVCNPPVWAYPRLAMSGQCLPPAAACLPYIQTSSLHCRWWQLTFLCAQMYCRTANVYSSARPPGVAR
jgi:hypothetical protein